MPQKLILDTDIDTDCDDAGALAMLHALIGRGECKLAGVICSVPLPACVGAVRAINASYGRESIPVGLVRVLEYATSAAWQPYREHHGKCSGTCYNQPLSASRPPNDPQPQDAVELYRRILAGAPDNSVTICAIGTLTALAQLLASAGDAISPLSGAELIRLKVRELISMAEFPFAGGRESFNWRMDVIAAARVLRDWPTPISISPAGRQVHTGARFVAAAPQNHPVRQAYVTFLGGEDRSRSSWDQIAALYAVRGMAGPFARSADRPLAIDPATAECQWQEPSATEPIRRWIVPVLPETAMSELIENLMIESLLPASAS